MFLQADVDHPSISYPQVETVTSPKALTRHVDNSQLTQAFDGHFPYNHGEWVQFFQKAHHFVGGLKKASELLRTTTQELEKEESLETLQAVERQVSRHRQLMQEVLRDAQLVSLQREGGATLARLRKEATRLGFTPDVRRSFESALAVYNLVEEEVHTLVTKSNGCLEHLEFLKKIREVEEGFHQVTLWIDEEGEPELSTVGLAEGSLEKTEESYRRFKDFFKEATEAAKIHGFKFPEMATFEAAKGAFQAKLTMFYMDMEMKGAELETFLDLYRFCHGVSPGLQATSGPVAGQGEGPQHRGGPKGHQRCYPAIVRGLFRGEVPADEAPSVQHAQRKRLLDLERRLGTSQEAKRILEDLLISFKEAKGITAGDCEEKRSPSAPNSSSSIPVDVLHVDETLEAANNLEPFSKETVDRKDSSQKKPSDMDVRGHKEASPGATLEFGGLDHQDLGEEPSGRPQRASWDSSPLCRSSASSPKAEPMPGTGDTLPPIGHSCAPLLVRGPPRPQKRERAQYFQLSRHGSFSSEDADSQNSSEDAVDSSSTWSMELQGLRGGGAQEKGLGILYLENHSPSSGSSPVKPET
ncbi:hypothetical protein E2320_009430 [Naja naja]|nr:hypothetical protein E2320_009430 [Naja naja]